MRENDHANDRTPTPAPRGAGYLGHQPAPPDAERAAQQAQNSEEGIEVYMLEDDPATPCVSTENCQHENANPPERPLKRMRESSPRLPVVSIVRKAPAQPETATAAPALRRAGVLEPPHSAPQAKSKSASSTRAPAPPASTRTTLKDRDAQNLTSMRTALRGEGLPSAVSEAPAVAGPSVLPTLQQSIHAVKPQAPAPVTQHDAQAAQVSIACAQYQWQSEQVRQLLLSMGYTATFHIAPLDASAGTGPPSVFVMVHPLPQPPTLPPRAEPLGERPACAAPPDRPQAARLPHGIATTSAHAPPPHATQAIARAPAAIGGTATSHHQAGLAASSATISGGGAQTQGSLNAPYATPEERMDVDFSLNAFVWQPNPAGDASSLADGAPYAFVNPAALMTSTQRPQPAHEHEAVLEATQLLPRAYELLASGVCVLPEPNDGFPPNYKRDPTDLARGISTALVTNLETKGDTAFGFEVNLQTDLWDDDFADALEILVFDTMALIVGHRNFKIIRPRKPKSRPTTSDYATLWLAHAMNTDSKDTFFSQRVWPFPYLTLHMHELRQSPGRYFVTYKGFPKISHDDIKALVIMHLKSSRVIKYTADAIAAEWGNPDGVDVTEAAHRLMDGVEVVVRVMADGGETVITASAYCDPPTTKSKEWKTWRDALMISPFMGDADHPVKFHGGIRCSGCHAADHLLVDCPFRNVAGWNGSIVLDDILAKVKKEKMAAKKLAAAKEAEMRRAASSALRKERAPSSSSASTSTSSGTASAAPNDPELPVSDEEDGKEDSAARAKKRASKSRDNTQQQRDRRPTSKRDRDRDAHQTRHPGPPLPPRGEAQEPQCAPEDGPVEYSYPRGGYGPPMTLARDHTARDFGPPPSYNAQDSVRYDQAPQQWSQTARYGPPAYEQPPQQRQMHHAQQMQQQPRWGPPQGSHQGGDFGGDAGTGGGYYGH